MGYALVVKGYNNDSLDFHEEYSLRNTNAVQVVESLSEKYWEDVIGLTIEVPKEFCMTMPIEWMDYQIPWLLSEIHKDYDKITIGIW